MRLAHTPLSSWPWGLGIRATSVVQMAWYTKMLGRRLSGSLIGVGNNRKEGAKPSVKTCSGRRQRWLREPASTLTYNHRCRFNPIRNFSLLADIGDSFAWQRRKMVLFLQSMDRRSSRSGGNLLMVSKIVTVALLSTRHHSTAIQRPSGPARLRCLRHWPRPIP